MKIYYLGKMIFLTLIWIALWLALILKGSSMADLQHNLVLGFVAVLGAAAGSSLAQLRNECRKDDERAPSA